MSDDIFESSAPPILASDVPQGGDLRDLEARIKRLESKARSNATFFTRPRTEDGGVTARASAEEANGERTRRALLQQYQHQIERAMAAASAAAVRSNRSKRRSTAAAAAGASASSMAMSASAAPHFQSPFLATTTVTAMPMLLQHASSTASLHSNSNSNSGGVADDHVDAAAAGARAFTEIIVSQLQVASNMTRDERLRERNSAATAALRERNERGLVSASGYRPLLQNPTSVPISHYVSAQLRLLKYSLENNLSYHTHFAHHCDNTVLQKRLSREAAIAASSNVDYVHENIEAVRNVSPGALLEQRRARLATVEGRRDASDAALAEWFASQAELHSLTHRGRSGSFHRQGRSSMVTSDAPTLLRRMWSANVVLASSVAAFAATHESHLQRDVERRRRRELALAARSKMTPQQMSRAWALVRRCLRAFVIRFKNRRMAGPVALVVRFLRHIRRMKQLTSAVPQYVHNVVLCQRQVRVYIRMRQARLVLLHLQYLRRECEQLGVPNAALHHLTYGVGSGPQLAAPAKSSSGVSTTEAPSSPVVSVGAGAPTSLPALTSTTSPTIPQSVVAKRGGGAGAAAFMGALGAAAAGGSPWRSGVPILTPQQQHLQAAAIIQAAKDARYRAALASGSRATTVVDVPWVPTGRDGQATTDYRTRLRLITSEMSSLLRRRVADCIRFDRDQKYYTFEKYSYDLQKLGKHGVAPPAPPRKPVFRLLTTPDALAVLVRLGISSSKPAPPLASPAAASLAPSSPPVGPLLQGGSAPTPAPSPSPLQPRRGSVVRVSAPAHHQQHQHQHSTAGSAGRAQRRRSSTGSIVSDKSGDDDDDNGLRSSPDAQQQQQQQQRSEAAIATEATAKLLAVSSPRRRKRGTTKDKKAASKGKKAVVASAISEKGGREDVKPDDAYARLLLQPSVAAMRKFLDAPQPAPKSAGQSSPDAADVSAPDIQPKAAMLIHASQPVLLFGPQLPPSTPKADTATTETAGAAAATALSVPPRRRLDATRPLVPPRQPLTARTPGAFHRVQAPLTLAELQLFAVPDRCAAPTASGPIPARPLTSAMHVGPPLSSGTARRRTATGLIVTQPKGRDGLGGRSVFVPEMAAGGDEVAEILGTLNDQRVAAALKKQARRQLA